MNPKTIPLEEALKVATQGQWSVGGHPGDGSGTAWRVMLAQGPFGPGYLGTALKSDAALICHAVELLPKLVAACEAIEKHLPTEEYCRGAVTETGSPLSGEITAILSFRAALLAAKTVRVAE